MPKGIWNGGADKLADDGRGIRLESVESCWLNLYILATNLQIF